MRLSPVNFGFKTENINFEVRKMGKSDFNREE